MINATIDAALVTEVELAFSPNGKAFARFRAVSKERKKDAGGNWVDGDETFFSCVVFGKPAEMLAETNPAKGTRLLIVGKAKMETWTSKQDGTERSGLSVIANSVALDLIFTAYEKVGGEQSARGAARRRDETPEDPWASSGGGYTDEPPF